MDKTCLDLSVLLYHSEIRVLMLIFEECIYQEKIDGGGIEKILGREREEDILEGRDLEKFCMY